MVCEIHLKKKKKSKPQISSVIPSPGALAEQSVLALPTAWAGGASLTPRDLTLASDSQGSRGSWGATCVSLHLMASASPTAPLVPTVPLNHRLLLSGLAAQVGSKSWWSNAVSKKNCKAAGARPALGQTLTAMKAATTHTRSSRYLFP